MAGEPIFTSALTATANENAGIVIDVNAVGDGTGSVEGDGSGITYSMLGDDVLDERLFDLNPFTGELSFRQPPDFETPLDEDGDNVYEVYVRATDEQNGQSTLQLLRITITDKPNDPIFTSSNAVTVDENNHSILDVEATSHLGAGQGAVEGDGLSYEIIYEGGVDGYLFSIDADTGELYFGQRQFLDDNGGFYFDTLPPDFENPQDADGNNVYEVTVAVRDYNSPDVVSYQNISITIADVADEPNLPPRGIELVNANTFIAENTVDEGGIKVGDVLVIDDGQGENELFLSGFDADRFELRGAELYFIGPALDFETQSFYEVRIEAIDFSLTEIPTASADVFLDVADIDEAPSDIEIVDAIGSIDENTVAATRIADVFAVDEDIDEFFRNNTITVDDARFEIVDNELRLKAGQVIDFETESSITLTLTAQGNTNIPGFAAFGIPVEFAEPVTRTFTLTVNDLNEAPTAIATANAIASVAENTAVATKIADVIVTDPDAAEAFRNNPVSVNDARFEVVGGELFLKAGQVIDFETEGSINLVLSTANGLTTGVTLGVDDVNEAATAIATANAIASVAENTAVATKIADVIVTDPDTAEAFRNNLVSVNDARFEVVNGELFLKAGQVIDFETAGSINLVLSTANGLSASLTLGVTDVNEDSTAIATANAFASIAENTAVSTKIADVIVTDPDIAAAFRDNPVSVNDARFEVVNGELRLKAGQAIDFETQNVINLVLSTASGLSTNLALAVTNVNEAPVAVNDAGSAGENETKSFNLVANDTDVDNAGSQLTLASFAVTSVSGIALTNAQAQSALSIVGNQLQFNPGTAFDPLNAGQQAVVTVAYTVRDPGGLTSNGTFQLTVNGAAETPTGNVITGTNGSNILIGTNGPDTMLGLGGADLLWGGNGNDALDGGAGNDVLLGGAGNDVLIGGTGIDYLLGGAGADTFKFGPGDSPGGNRFGGGDFIDDFSRAEGDKIDVSAIDANAGAAGDQAFTSLIARGLGQGVGAAAGTIVVQGGANVGATTVFLHTNGDGIADFSFTLDLRSTAANALQLSDFIL